MAKLTIAAVRDLASKPERYEVPDDAASGGVAGLVVRIVPSGVKSFALYYRRRTDGVLRRLTLGRFGGPGGMTLHEARERAGDNLEIVRAGGDPAGDRKRQRLAAAEAKANPSEPVTLAALVRAHLTDGAHELRPKTLETYRIAVEKFIAWADAKRIKTPAELTRAHLAEFRTHLAALPRHAGKPGGKRGSKRDTGEKRSPLSVNRELRTMKTILNAMRKAGKLPQLDRDALTDNLAALRTDREEPSYLTPSKIAKLLRACARHDTATFKETRDEHARRRPVGTTARYVPLRPFAVFLLLTGCRRGEALGLRWDDVDLDATDHDGRLVGEIRLPAAITKTRRARTIYLDVCPSLRRMLAAMKVQRKADRVFEGYTADLVEAGRQRLQADYGAPAFDWKLLRSTCATYLTNAPGIFGAATAYMSARQLGHSVVVAEKHYTGVLRVSRDARTLEDAMRIAADDGQLSAGTVRLELRRLGE